MRQVKCAKCGKTFTPAPYHVFKSSDKYFCKWTCYNHRNDTIKEKNAYEDYQNRLTKRT